MNETSVAKIKESKAFARQFMVTKKTWPNNEVAIYELRRELFRIVNLVKGTEKNHSLFCPQFCRCNSSC